MEGVEEYELDVAYDETAEKSWDSRVEVLKSGIIMTITLSVRTGSRSREQRDPGWHCLVSKKHLYTGIDFYYSALSNRRYRSFQRSPAKYSFWVFFEHQFSPANASHMFEHLHG